MDKLKGKTLLIGKEPGQGRLLVAISGTGKSAAIGAAGSVPGCVSRCKVGEDMAHAKLAIDGNGEMVLTNMKTKNVTYVNGSEIASKHISTNAAIELGKDHYRINLPLVLEAARKIMSMVDGGGGGNKQKYNISHLQKVWEDFEATNETIAQRQQEMGRRRMLPIMIGSLSGVASPVLAALVAVNTLYLTVPVAAISFGLYFMNYRKKDTSFQDRKDAMEQFTDDYVCPNPNCGKFLGNLSYKLLKKQYGMHCPYCKCEYEES